MRAPRAIARDLATGIIQELARTNFRGRRVTLAEGAAVLTATSALAARSSRADALALGAIGALGLADDIVEPRQRRRGAPVAKGLRGHVAALVSGRLTTGGAKLLGIPLVCVAAAALAPEPRIALLDGAIAASSANVANLLDLRPGRALKAVAVPALALAALPVRSAEDDARGERVNATRARSGRALAAAAALPALLALPLDVRERGMLGDSGANVLGAAVGAAAARRLGVPARLALLGGLLALTVASERVSFSAVIARTPWLDRIDRAGRRPDEPARPGPAAPEAAA